MYCILWVWKGRLVEKLPVYRKKKTMTDSEIVWDGFLQEATRNEAPDPALGSDASARMQILFGDKRRATWKATSFST